MATRKNFILLLSLSKASAAYGAGMLARIQRDVDSGAKPAWIDPLGVGIFISSPLTAHEIWAKAIPDHLPSHERTAFRDMMVLELGSDCLAWPESRAGAWLNSHKAQPT